MSKEEASLHAVIYTDGGCKPSRGVGGWGIHGYIYTTEKAKQGTGCPQQVTNFGYIDATEGAPGSSFYNYKAADRDPEVEYFVDPQIRLVTPLQYIDGYGSQIPESTNNIAEVTGLLEALQVVIENKAVIDVMLVIDSKYALNGLLNWSRKWAANNWVRPDTTPVANAELWQQVLEAKRILEERGTQIYTRWVRGHSGDLGNDAVDLLASSAVIAGKKGLSIRSVELTDSKGYWSFKADYNRMISHPYWYFNTNVGGTQKSPDGRVVYYLGEHGAEDDFVGKPVSSASFSVLFLKERNPVLEMITAHQDSLDTGGFNSMVIGRVNNITSAKVYTELEKYGDKFLHQHNYGKMDLFTPANLLLTKELRPPRIAFRVMQQMGVMESMLIDYIADPASKGVVVNDITGLLYEVNTAKKKPVTKLLPAINSTVKRLEIEAAYDTGVKAGVFKLPVTIGIDIANRNTLSALAALNPKVHLITWRESDTAFRYATIIQTDDDIGIWAGIYSNICLLTS